MGGPVVDTVTSIISGGGGGGGNSTPSTPAVTPKPVVTPRAAVKVGQRDADKKKKRATVRRGVPRRMSSSVLGAVAGEQTKAKLGD